jgi:tRNA(fMet)-specific endonuclease VapC
MGMTHYLLDTNICIYIINKRPPEVFERFRRIKLMQLHIPTIVISELYFGIEKTSPINAMKLFSKTSLRRFLSPAFPLRLQSTPQKSAASSAGKEHPSVPMTSRSPPLLWPKIWSY